jgi:hypothetical protein
MFGISRSTIFYSLLSWLSKYFKITIKTRLEAQSLLNQIAQSRSLKEQEINQCNQDMESINQNGNNLTSNNMNALDSDSNSNLDLSMSNYKLIQQQKSANQISSVGQATSSGATTTTTTTTTTTVTDSDSEAEGAFNDFQIKRFPLRKDI